MEPLEYAVTRIGDVFVVRYGRTAARRSDINGADLAITTSAEAMRSINYSRGNRAAVVRIFVSDGTLMATVELMSQDEAERAQRAARAARRRMERNAGWLYFNRACAARLRGDKTNARRYLACSRRWHQRASA